jgi:protein-serine/threonine kinase
MLSDFDLSKQSGEPGGAPIVIKQSTQNGVSWKKGMSVCHGKHGSSNAHHLPSAQAMLVDTKSCIADFRTNSFVGTEGE